MNYPGYRIILKIKFIEGTLRDNLQIDIGVGDQVVPKSKQIELLSYKKLPLFEQSISLLVYPPESIYAEKLETIISKGSINSRMKDFHDLILMAREPGLLVTEHLVDSITKTFQHRGTSLVLPIEFQETEYNVMNQYWLAHGTTVGAWWSENNMPSHFKDAVGEVNRFLNSIPLKS